MATNCSDLEAEVTVCVDGPVGGGNTATLQVFVNSAEFNATNPIGSPSNWDGSAKTYAGWASSFFGCDTVVSSSLTITLVGTNEVEVTIEIVVDDCSGSEIYSDCGPSFGPHTFTDTQIVTMTGLPCVA